MIEKSVGVTDGSRKSSFLFHDQGLGYSSDQKYSEAGWEDQVQFCKNL